MWQSTEHKIDPMATCCPQKNVGRHVFQVGDADKIVVDRQIGMHGTDLSPANWPVRMLHLP